MNEQRRRLRNVFMHIPAFMYSHHCMRIYYNVGICIYTWAWANGVAYHKWVGTWKGLENRGKQRAASHGLFFVLPNPGKL